MKKSELKEEIKELKAEREVLYQQIALYQHRIKHLKSVNYGQLYGSPIDLNKVAAAL